MQSKWELTNSNCCLILSVQPEISLWPPLLSFCPSSHPLPHLQQITHKTTLAWVSCLSSSYPSLLPSLSRLLNPSDNASHQTFHYSAQGASPLHQSVMDFQCFEHLSCHVIVSLPWVASLCLEMHEPSVVVLQSDITESSVWAAVWDSDLLLLSRSNDGLCCVTATQKLTRPNRNQIIIKVQIEGKWVKGRLLLLPYACYNSLITDNRQNFKQFWNCVLLIPWNRLISWETIHALWTWVSEFKSCLSLMNIIGPSLSCFCPHCLKLQINKCGWIEFWRLYPI